MGITKNQNFNLFLAISIVRKEKTKIELMKQVRS